ncbi:MAG: mannose-1-phosphate guanylyltransferase [Bradyrhizobiaceae bacterium]|nr:mannose-1-phosphate guanylyltransferase [Bradyrhizobiaceae bacterium]
MNIAAVVLAGGLGSRLWPRGTDKQPKQFTHVLGDGTMIQNTVMRLLPFVSADNLWVVTTAELAPHVYEQLPLVAPQHVLTEPFGRNTGPSIALAATMLKHHLGEDAVMVVLPSDHMITNVREFQATLERACTAAAQADAIVTIGVMPTRAETGYGYIQVGDAANIALPDMDGAVHKVITFAEKPDHETAQRFMDAGDFVWNAGIFVARVGVILKAVTDHLPDHAPLFAQLSRHIGTDRYEHTLDTIFRQIRSVSFDVGVMERAKNVLVVDGSFGWSDVGTWDELYRLSMKDGRNNVVEGNVVTLRTNNCMITSNSGRLVGVVGLENLVIVDTEHALMICKRGKTEQVHDLIDLIRRRHIGNFKG